MKSLEMLEKAAEMEKVAVLPFAAGLAALGKRALPAIGKVWQAIKPSQYMWPWTAWKGWRTGKLSPMSAFGRGVVGPTLAGLAGYTVGKTLAPKGRPLAEAVQTGIPGAQKKEMAEPTFKRISEQEGTRPGWF